MRQVTGNSYSHLYIRMIRSRIILHQLVNDLGLNHPKVIQHSQKMDKLITELQEKKKLIPPPEQSAITC